MLNSHKRRTASTHLGFSQVCKLPERGGVDEVISNTEKSPKEKESSSVQYSRDDLPMQLNIHEKSTNERNGI